MGLCTWPPRAANPAVGGSLVYPALANAVSRPTLKVAMVLIIQPNLKHDFRVS
jgi:hypothetical protein